MTEWRQERRDDLELEVFFVAVAVGAALEDADLGVEPLDQAQAELVLRVTTGGDSVPMSLYQVSELSVGFEPLPPQRLAPAVEEAPRPALGLVVPQLPGGSPRAKAGCNAGP